MAIRLLRQVSETPSITNKDDARMVRYAYGGYNGVVKDFGSELDSVFSGGLFKLYSGRIVLDGWEVDVDDNGWQISVLAMSGTQYYSVYLEVNLITETSAIKSTYSTKSYPSIDKGDDLTTYPSGVARMLLYNFKASAGIIQESHKKFQIIPYTKTLIEEIDRRLNNLGFNPLPTGYSSSILVSGASIGELQLWEGDKDNHLGSFREGNFVHLAMEISLSYDSSSGYIPAQERFYRYGDTATVSFKLPSQFVPKSEQILYTSAVVYLHESNSDPYFATPIEIVIHTDGSITMQMALSLSLGIAHDGDYDISITNNYLEISYEANPKEAA